MKVKTPVVGGICESLQGRDKGRVYIIKEILPDGSILVTDGNFKRLASPKKKNPKHLRYYPERAESIGNKLLTEQKVFDTEVYSALKSYNCPQSSATEGEADVTNQNETENGKSDV